MRVKSDLPNPAGYPIAFHAAQQWVQITFDMRHVILREKNAFVSDGPGPWTGIYIFSNCIF